MSAEQARAVAAQRLVRLRSHMGLTLSAVAAALGVTISTIFRIEHGLTTPRAATAEALLSLYGVEDRSQRRYVLALLRGERSARWYDESVVPLGLATSWDLEQRACEIRTYQLQFIPPLLQTESYARAVCEVASTSRSRTLPLEAGVGFIMARQNLMDRSDSPRIWAVLDESVLLRSVGGPEVRLQQLDALIDHAKRPNVTVQIANMEEPVYLPCTGPFTLCRFAGLEDPDVAAVHSFAFDQLITERDVIEPYLLAFDYLATHASVPGAPTLDLLHRHRDSLASRLA